MTVQDAMLVIILWVTCGIATVVAGLLAYRSSVARYVGRGAVGVLFLLGGAVVHLVNLVTGVDYGDFADPSFFGWVTDTWHEVVEPNQVLFIGMLAAFEAVVGVLAMCGGRLTRFAYRCVIVFYLALWLFGWMELAWVLLMLPPMFLLLRAERWAAVAGETARTG
ncbi:hypothetical protein [Promicromonospora sp. MEB111]|uniref:hypothetical protein n=1 Tax=Promicromonospora sp. MEB111 TaxID=3040301 RepID=UPI0025517BEF|nr:hypothetical protein [Promicromonospora sp. MEB111]